MNRRQMITGTAAIPAVAVALPASASPAIGPVEACLHEYRRRNEWFANKTPPVPDGPEFYATCDWIDAPLNEGLTMTPETVSDFAAFALLALLDGDQHDGSKQMDALLARSRAALIEGA